MSDILPFVEDSRPSALPPKPEPAPPKQEKAPKEKSKENAKENAKETNDNDNHALSYEQVNDNADELIELRGEGRYFGVTDPSSGATINSLQSLGPLCGNCHRRGHIRAKCKTVVCHKCGVVGDHYETQCPTTMICSRCGNKGHVATSCTNKTRKRQYCKSCDSFSHTDDNCPSIWRSYLTKKVDGESTTLPLMFCYNCGDDTHFGDECPKMRSSRIPNLTGSAFSGSNLPRHLREIYFARLKQVGERPSRSGFLPQRPTGPNAYGNNNYGSGNYGSGNNNHGSGYGKTYNSYPSKPNPRDFQASDKYPAKKQSSQSKKNTSQSKKNPKKPERPTRSGYIAKPTRSGLIEKKKKKNMNMMY